MKSTIVIGHKNPDTDSICSAICYAALKRTLTGENYVPCRAGEINNETQFVLEKFGVEPPEPVESLEPRISDVQYREVEGISPQISLKRAWEHMRDSNIQSLPVVTKRGKIKGIITLGDEARFYLEDQDPRALSKASTPFLNIAQTLWGEIIVGDPEAKFSKGKIVVAAYHPSAIEDSVTPGDLVIVGSNTEIQKYAIERGASCIVICVGSKVTPAIRKRAEEAGCIVIVSPMDLYACSKLITHSMPVGHIMRKDGIIAFNADEPVADVKATVSKLRIRYFPVLDGNDCYLGMMSQRNLLDIERQKVILVDHNEKGQAIDGIASAEVVEVIDHHRIDSVETVNPIYFRAQPLGCTATIVTMMYREHHIEIEPTIAGLLCSAILSDTLMFRSPTCTPADEAAARELAEIAGIKIKEYAMAMFNAGSKLGKKTPDEIFHIDCKRFNAATSSIMVSQVTSVSEKELSKVKNRMLPYMEKLLPTAGVDMLFTMLTNIIDQSTELLFVGQNSKAAVQSAFSCEPKSDSVFLPGVVSRKKQVIAPLIAAIDEL
ncbi:MAG: putative manganese-dependent inorganic diphosphatase [Ruminococcus sp.]|nr:putative manganese-dependent inorganic diphosphatase [Ruminococcus sp.]